jgi:hypothetical protein
LARIDDDHRMVSAHEMSFFGLDAMGSHSSSPDPRKYGLWVIAAFCAWGVWVLYLCWSVPHLPLADLPNHMARLFIQEHYDTDPYIRAYYQPYWHFQPNLALDALGYLLSPYLGILTIERLLGLVTFVSLATGLATLYRVAHGRWSPFLLLAMTLIVNRFFAWGSLGYLLTLGVAFVAFAMWISLRARPCLRFVVCSVLSTVVYFGHLYAFGVCAVCVVGYELAQPGAFTSTRSTIWRAALTCVPFLPAVLCFALLSPSAAAYQATRWPPLTDKLQGIVALLPGYDLSTEAVLTAACFAVAGIGWLLDLAKPRRHFLAPIGLLAMLYLVMPSELLGGYGADRRLLVPLAMLVLISFDWVVETPRARFIQLALALALAAASSANVSHAWLSSTATYKEIDRLTSAVERGARLAGFTVVRTRQYLAFPALSEVAAYAVVESSAFVPSLYSYPEDASTALRYSAACADRAFRSNIIYAPGRNTPQSLFEKRQSQVERAGIEYLLVIDSGKQPLRVPESYRLVLQTSDDVGRLFSLPH